MAAEVGNRNQPIPRKVEEPFIDKHFAKIAFAISTLVLLIFSPLVAIFGTAAGLVINFVIDPELKVHPTHKIITVPHAVFAIVGAIAALLRMTPAGSMGGFVFKAVPFIASFALGSVAYRVVKAGAK